MSERAKRVLEEALQLPLEERGELVRKLLESLEGDASTEIEHAWAPAISRRAREVLDGTAPMRDLTSVADSRKPRRRY